VALDEKLISRAIIERFTEKLLDSLQVEVAVVGAGPAGLLAAYRLASAGRKVCLIERKLSPGGGMWGGGMMCNEIVVQHQAKYILDELGVRARAFQGDYFTADSVEAASSLIYHAVHAGARLFNLMCVEDVCVRGPRVSGLVVNWTAVEMATLHVDPLTIAARCIVDATGHDADVVRRLEGRVDGLRTPSGRCEGQRPLWAERAEQTTLENTREVYPGLWVAGMCANATFGSFRMGPIFGGMLLSGEKVAEQLLAKLAEER
jgi:thiamine thiazole synthase